MVRSRFFNSVLFAIAAFSMAWLLRDNPHCRILPVLSAFFLVLYSGLFILSLVIPNGFKLKPGEEAISFKLTWLRPVFISIPIFTVAYFTVYSLLLFASDFVPASLDSLYLGIAKFEKSAFGKHRAQTFCSSALTKLDQKTHTLGHSNRLSELRALYLVKDQMFQLAFDGRRPGDLVAIAYFLEKEGQHKRAADYYSLVQKNMTWIKSEQTGDRYWKHFAIPKIRLVTLFDGVLSRQLLKKLGVDNFELAEKTLPVCDLTDFVYLDMRPYITDYREKTSSGKLEEGACITATTLRTALKNFAPDELPASLKKFRNLHPEVHFDILRREDFSFKSKYSYRAFPDCPRDLVPCHFVVVNTEDSKLIRQLSSNRDGKSKSLEVSTDFSVTREGRIVPSKVCVYRNR